MIDRLLPLLLVLTLAPGALRPECCCAMGVCPVAAPGEDASDLPPCCRAKAELPPCCQAGSTGRSQTAPCRCPDCPSAQPVDPLQVPSASPSVEAAEGASLIVVYSSWPTTEAAAPPRVVASPGPLDRPPPDRQALLCVWTI